MMIDLSLFIKWNRTRKKLKIYKQLALLSFDLTIIFYVALILGYVFFSIVSEGTLIAGVQQQFAFLKDVEFRSFSYVVLVLPIIYLFRAFSYPGITLSSTEYTMSIQPVKRIHIWWMLAIEKWLKHAVIYSFIGIIFAFLSGTSTINVLFYVLLLLGLNIVMTPLQWRFFQTRLWQKLIYLLLLFLIDGLIFFVDIQYVICLLVVLLLISNILCLPRLMTRVNWAKVTAAADFKIWSMPLISQMTKVKFQKPRKYTIWQRMHFYKKPFHYEKNTVYHRLWQLHVEKNKSYILKISGVLFLFLLVTVFLKQWLFLVAVFVMTQVYTNLMAALFKDRFQEEIVAILPWDLKKYRDTFHLWSFSISCVYIVPAILYVIQYTSLYSSFQLFLFAILFVMQLRERLNKQIQLMDKTFPFGEHILQLCAAGMVFTFLSLFHMLFLLLAMVTVAVLLVMKNRQSKL